MKNRKVVLYISKLDGLNQDFRPMNALFKNVFVIPVYQRIYTWDENRKDRQVEDFFYDAQALLKNYIHNASSNYQRYHFFGQIFVYRHNGVFKIIDGQQRLITSQLFLIALRDLASEKYGQYVKNTNNGRFHDDYKDVHVGVQDILFKKGIGGHRQQTLKVNRSHNDSEIGDYFNLLLRSKFTSDNRHITPIKNMQRAYKLLKRLINNDIKSKSAVDGMHYLRLGFDVFSSNFFVSLISTPDAASASDIFTTLNTRGKPLSKAAIIRSRVISEFTSKGGMARADNKWTKINNILKYDEEAVTSFIQDYWSARHSYKSINDLYRSIKNYVDDEHSADGFLNDLDDLVMPYDAISSNHHQRTNDEREWAHDKGIASIIDIFRRFNFTTYYPIVLAMAHSSYDKKSNRIILNEILKLFIRNIYISDSSQKRLPAFFSKISRKIWESVDDINTIVKEIDKHMLPSSSVKDDFLERLRISSNCEQGSSKWKLAYLLANLYKYSPSQDFGGRNDTENLLYEKVFNNEYDLIRIKDVEMPNDDQNLVGNWTLIEDSLYRQLKSNRSNLKDILNRSNLVANNKLSNIIGDDWSDKDIIDRQHRLCDGHNANDDDTPDDISRITDIWYVGFPSNK